jgi:hypothetical protein
VEISYYKIPSRVNKHTLHKGLRLSEAGSRGDGSVAPVKLWLKMANIFKFSIMIDSKIIFG